MTDPLTEVARLFAVNLDADRAEAIDAARAAGATWQQIAEAMGYTDRQVAEQWRRRH